MDDLLQASLILALFLFLFLGAGLWVSLALIGVGVVGMSLFTGAPWGPLMASTIWGGINAWSLAALPLFIWMGEILFRSRLSDDLFEGLVPWMTRLPGRLLHVNIFGCGIFAAVSGSSAATAATVGKMAIPELARRGYGQNMVLGTLAGSATLGLLIPPSIILIVYGVATEQSIARLFMAGILPGLMLMALFVGFVMIWALLNPKAVPPLDRSYSWADRFKALPRLAPVLLLIAGVIGSIYAGIASPTDAAAVGVFLALALSVLSGDLTRKTFLEGLLAATRTSCMIVFILAGASFLTLTMGFTGIPAGLAAWIASMELSPHALLAALTVFFVVMGCFLDGISIVVLTTSIIQPMIETAGIDTIWFGIFLVIVVEMSQITPPVGFNLFVIQSLTNKNMLSIAWAALPFFLLMAVALVLLTLFPDIATWLPNRM
ncbi:MAG: TRAP transporter large permease subunit [Rhodospirillum sp.]|nr:TRAP transporter large permease subunit [Rhodospirillum sp.]MCF8488954.1 TRAP transporter large permease subunit [Rhodospirillum sp.]MCF8499010.1 TRAP transporter large permease subunit [Rhodospirillum sp.]